MGANTTGSRNFSEEIKSDALGLFSLQLVRVELNGGSSRQAIHSRIEFCVGLYSSNSWSMLSGGDFRWGTTSGPRWPLAMSKGQVWDWCKPASDWETRSSKHACGQDILASHADIKCTV